VIFIFFSVEEATRGGGHERARRGACGAYGVVGSIHHERASLIRFSFLHPRRLDTASGTFMSIAETALLLRPRVRFSAFLNARVAFRSRSLGVRVAREQVAVLPGLQVARAAREAQEAEGVPGAVRGGHRGARRGVSVPRKAAAWSLKAFGSPDPRNRRSASEFSVLVVRGSSAHEAARAGKSCGHPRCVRGRRACQHARARAGDGPRATRASRQRDDQRLPLAVSSHRFVPFVRSRVPTPPAPTSRSGAPRAGAPRFSSPPRSPTRPS